MIHGFIELDQCRGQKASLLPRIVFSVGHDVAPYGMDEICLSIVFARRGFAP